MGIIRNKIYLNIFCNFNFDYLFIYKIRYIDMEFINSLNSINNSLRINIIIELYIYIFKLNIIFILL